MFSVLNVREDRKDILEIYFGFSEKKEDREENDDNTLMCLISVSVKRKSL